MLAAEDRLTDLFEISVDEVAWRNGHRYLTLIGDHRRRWVVWGCAGKGQAAADRGVDPAGGAAPDLPRNTDVRGHAWDYGRRKPKEAANATTPHFKKPRRRQARPSRVILV
jgi:hypothetical protein